MSREQRFDAAAAGLQFSPGAEIKVGGHYVPLVRHGDLVYLSGQLPRVGDSVVVTGAVGAETSLAQARVGAGICVMRALTLLQRALGSLDAVRGVLQMNVYVRSAPGFTQQSEVADAASDLLVEVLGPQAAPARTSVGVAELPKSASVEIDLVASVV